MANPICLSPLKFYDDPAKQNHRKSYAYGHIVPVLNKRYGLVPFQFVLPEDVTWESGHNRMLYVWLIDVKDETRQIDVSNRFRRITRNEDFYYELIERRYYGEVLAFRGDSAIFNDIPEGLYYLKIEIQHVRVWAAAFYSEVFSISDNTDDCLEIEYWNSTGDFEINGGGVAFGDSRRSSEFHFKLLLRTEIGKPEYEFEEEATKRLGYSFVESQVSKKIFKFNTVAPEYLCDAMRIIRLCDNKIIRCKGEEYKALSFEMEVEWEEQGDLASVDCSFEVDNVIVNFGGHQIIDDPSRGSYSPKDFNGDFDNYDPQYAQNVV